ncbi:MAG: hypothetical protein M1497_06940 [Nitrospirae bacterium]|nr:hypothetical protein [Nitrospirota bacterium]
MAHETTCVCGNGVAGFNFRNEILSEEVIRRVYCPVCSRDIRLDPPTMVADNGWIIEYDMEIARFQAVRIPAGPEKITPDFIFDEGYCTWRGIYPTDHIDSAAERSEVLRLAKINPRRYLSEIKEWAKARMERLSQEGWRKAREYRAEV